MTENEIEQLNAIKLGQVVWFEVVAEASGATLRKWLPFTVVRIRIDSDTDKVFPVYAISNDPPAPYHYGKVAVENVGPDKLRLENPEGR